MIEAMQVTEPYRDGQDNVDTRMHSREQVVDDAMDIEGEEVRAREEAAEGQMAKSQQTHGNIQLLLKWGDEKVWRNTWVGRRVGRG
jgi:hypothetical protein